MKNRSPKYAFFGSSRFSVVVLDEMEKAELIPSLIVTTPDRPAGRGQRLSASPVKIWAESRSIPIFQPHGFKDSDNMAELKRMAPDPTKEWDIFIVASYGYILPSTVIYMPKFKSLNIHPSLLPKLRGPSPIQEAILKEEETGVTIMRMDEKMDHGPILGQSKLKYQLWPPDSPTLEYDLAKEGARLLVDIIPLWTQGKIKETPQNEKEATYSSTIKKDDALLDIENESPDTLLRKVRAYKDRPKAHFFLHSAKKEGMRIIVTEAAIKNGKLEILRVIPEGKKEMKYEDFLKGL